MICGRQDKVMKPRAHFFAKVDTVVSRHFCVYTFAVVSAYAEQEFIS